MQEATERDSTPNRWPPSPFPRATPPTKPPKKPKPSRRSQFGGVASLVAGAAVLAAAANAAPAQDADAALVALADEIAALDRESNRLNDEEDLLPTGSVQACRARHDYHETHIRPLSHRINDLRAELAELPATTIAGFRAKARVIQVYSNCFSGFAYTDEDDALAWSLANDLLGVTSVWRDDGAEHGV
jgi:hypothetical protein